LEIIPVGFLAVIRQCGIPSAVGISIAKEFVRKNLKGAEIGRTELRTLRERGGGRGTLLFQLSGHFRSQKTKKFLDLQYPLFSAAPFPDRIAALAWGYQLRQSVSRFNSGKTGSGY
jgi:hypothetical protein